MDMLNLENTVVMYEGQQYSAKNLMLKLQEQIRDASNRLNSIACLLDELYKAMENTKTVDVKLSLSKAEYERFKSLGGEDDRERVLQAIRAVIGQGRPSPQPAGDIASPIEPVMASLGIPKTAHPQPISKEDPRHGLGEELSVSVSAVEEPILQAPVRKKPAPKCPRCGQPLTIPDGAVGSLPIEIKCDHCGAKCLIKSKMNITKSDKNEYPPPDDPSFGNIFDMLST